MLSELRNWLTERGLWLTSDERTVRSKGPRASPGRIAKPGTIRHGKSKKDIIRPSSGPRYTMTPGDRLMAHLRRQDVPYHFAVSMRARQLMAERAALLEAAEAELQDFEREHSSEMAGITRRAFVAVFPDNDDVSGIGQKSRALVRRRNALEARRNRLKAIMRRAQRRCHLFCDEPAFENAQRALLSPGCLEALVDDQRLRQLLFSEDPERDPQTDNEFLLYLSGETGRLPDLLAASIQARHVLYERYATDDKMEGEYNARVQRMDENTAAIDELRRANVADEDPRIHEKLQADAQMAVQLREYIEQWQAVEDSLEPALNQAHIYDNQVMRTAYGALRGTELLEGRTDLPSLRRQLFEGEKVPTPFQATSSKNSEAAADGTQDEHSELEERSSPREIAQQERNKAYNAYVDAQKLLEEHLNGYHAAMDKHRNGQDPGIAGWENSWSTAEFDLHRLKHGQEITRNVIEAEKRLLRALKVARDLGVPPLEQIRFAFADQTDDGQCSGSPRARIANAPRLKIERWMGDIPSTPSRARHNEAKSPPSMTIYLRTPKNWESESTTADHPYGKIIQKTGPRGPRGGTLEAVSEFEESEDAFK